MQSAEKRNSIGQLAVLTSLWLINILILIFGFPFLIFKKLQEIYFQTNKNSSSETKLKAARYFPCRMDS